MNLASKIISAVIILKKWQLDPQQRMILLGCKSTEELSKIENPPTLILPIKNLIQRVNLIISIDKFLRLFFNNPVNINNFRTLVNKNNPYNGKRPLDLAMSNLAGFIKVTKTIEAMIYY